MFLRFRTFRLERHAARRDAAAPALAFAVSVNILDIAFRSAAFKSADAFPKRG